METLTNLLVGLQPVITHELSAGTDYAPKPLYELGQVSVTLHRPQLYSALDQNHKLALVVNPLAVYKRGAPSSFYFPPHRFFPAGNLTPISARTQSQPPTAMSAPCDFDPVADATLYLANDIPVPYYPDQEPKTNWMAVKLEAVKDFLRKQEVYAPLIRRTQPNTEPAAASLTAKGKECAKSPTVKTKLADDHGLPPASLMRRRPTNPESSTTVMQVSFLSPRLLTLF
ncbi:hypothetical protein PCANC_20346 [Puccinia coronata f. sp. avenae]|uniref:Uncharacterized protein n=1 Tax=Puccinia coronata f. sp. avenae TaxID=200324 RepID=A0A2N5UG07_9BASI|nr:hypothetical protein PCANC_20346 [Puccinia coronata f. sp. avenae]